MLKGDLKRKKVNPESNKAIAVNDVKDLYAGDTDGDGLKDWEEVLWKTDPNNSDTNGNGIPDGEEVNLGKNPLTSLPFDEETLRQSGEIYANPSETKLSKPLESESALMSLKRNKTLDNYVSSVSIPQNKIPEVFSVSPNRVRRGDTVNVIGINFLPTGNKITLKDGPVFKQFNNLKSTDGKTISFIYEPPIIQTMSEEEIRSLPPNVISQIETPIKAAGGTLTDALTPYKRINSESELSTVLRKNGHFFDELYNFYFVTVENSGGKTTSETAVLHGLRSLPIPGLAVDKTSHVLSSLGQYLGKFLAPLMPVAYAQFGQYGGGFNTGIIMICTCGDGYLTFMTDFNGGGSGLYVFSWGFMADAGAGFISPNWLGGYQTMSGTCPIFVVEDCIDIYANEPENPWGTNLF